MFALEGPVAHRLAKLPAVVGPHHEEAVRDHDRELDPDRSVGGHLRVDRDVVAVGRDGHRHQQKHGQHDGERARPHLTGLRKGAA
ncbi:MAG: hypothetical protein U5J98_01825 [Halobacteriales archaeon]|nr:hypothetical protein [Halobacteriales archaeon]